MTMPNLTGIRTGLNTRQWTTIGGLEVHSAGESYMGFCWQVRARLRTSGYVVLAAGVPVAVMGIINLAHGGYFLANGLFGKSEMASVSLTSVAALAKLRPRSPNTLFRKAFTNRLNCLVVVS